MSDVPEKKPLTETAVDRKIAAELEKIREAQAKRDAEQDAKLDRPSVALRAVRQAERVDFTQKYPITSTAIGVAFVAGSLYALEGVKLYIGVGIGVCFVPGLVMLAIRLATGIRKAKDGAA